MNKFFFYIGLLIIVSGCLSSQERAKKRFNKLVEKNPELIDTVTVISRDTLINTDTLILQSEHHDTVFNILTDSVFILQEGRVKTEVRIINKERIKIVTDVRADTIIKTDTVFRVIERQVQVINTRKDWRQYIKPCLWWLFIILLIVGLVKYSFSFLFE